MWLTCAKPYDFPLRYIDESIELWLGAISIGYFNSFGPQQNEFQFI